MNIVNDFLCEELTGSVLKSFYQVYNELGHGFLERVYQNALYYELKHNGFEVEAQKKIKVYYKEMEVGDYFADIVVNDKLILEIKTVDALTKQHHSQLVNYLKSTNCEVGLLLNFGKKPEFIRKVFENYRK